jgi:hypothetical protein
MIRISALCSGFAAILVGLCPFVISAQQEGGSQRPEVLRVARFDVSPPLRTLTPVLFTKARKAEDDLGAGPVGNFRHDPDGALQTWMGRGAFSEGEGGLPGTDANFAGMTNIGGITPPDPVGDIGPNHYVQMVNSRFQIFTRTGVSVYGPATINSLFLGFGGACETENAGDPVVLYDQLADRWLLSQFSDGTAPFFNCVAISTSGDPTGTYYRYAISAPAFPDYPKYGVWPDSYVLTTRESGAGVIGVYGLDRAQMIAGNPAAQVVRFTVAQTAQGPNGLLPADLDGDALPPPGAPNYIVGSRDDGFGAPSDALMLFKLKPDWTTPANSTFTGPTILPIAAFDTVFPCGGTGRACIPQPGTSAMLDILSYRQRPTFRLAYRNFGTHESLVTSQSVEAMAGVAGMRWWEIRDPNGSPVVYQEGTYAPNDGVHRWMGSVAMDRQGNMALGYSVSNGTNVFPGIRYTGRLVNDPLGTMPQGEGVIATGAGSQTSTGNRWGDYSSMNIDPTDDCTFWYTNQYYTTTSATTWVTRIASFKFPGCDAATAQKAPADFDGDGKSDIAMFRPSSGTWFVLKSQSGTADQLQFGQNGDVPVDADIDGDLKTDHTVWRPTTGEWFYRRSTTGTFGGAVWGVNGDRPVPADYDGDGFTDIAVWRPSDGINYIVRSSGGFLGVQWGGIGDIPAHADRDGDGKTDFSVFRPSNGTWYTLINGTTTTESFQFGQIGDMPGQGDIDGDSRGDLLVWRPATGEWFFRRSTNGTFGGLQWGANGDRPVPGDYDGDGKTDFGVWRSLNGIHYIVYNAGGFLGVQWGAQGDLPILGSPMP